MLLQGRSVVFVGRADMVAQSIPTRWCRRVIGVYGPGFLVFVEAFGQHAPLTALLGLGWWDGAARCRCTSGWLEIKRKSAATVVQNSDKKMSYNLYYVKSNIEIPYLP